MDLSSKVFIEALKIGDIDTINEVEKTDLHNHSGSGGRLSYVLSDATVPTIPFVSLKEMYYWWTTQVKSKLDGVGHGYMKRVESAFHQAKKDNIKLLALNFSYENIQLLGGIEHFIKSMKTLHCEQCPDTIVLPELGFACYQELFGVLDELDEIFSYKYFTSIDIHSGESREKILDFVPIYRKARNYGLKLKAHVGETGNADDIMYYVDTLDLDEIHHGIAAVHSPHVMKFLASNNIRLNICPTSNVMLSICESYDKHPIRVLYDNDVIVTINTDDLMIFNSSVSEEFIKLYQCGLMKAEELDKIRINGLELAYTFKQEVEKTID